MRFSPGLQGLRGVAILLVLAQHTGLLPGGWVGVDLFFALSGYLITRLLADEWQRGGIRLGRFYGRRARRLLPALTLVVAVVSVVEYVCGVSVAGVAAALYTQNLDRATSGFYDPYLGHFWSLAQEEQFYLVWPALLLLGLRLRQPWILPAVLLVAALVNLHLIAGAPVDRLYYGPDTHALPMLAGCLLALVPTPPTKWALGIGIACLLPALALGLQSAGIYESQALLAAGAGAGLTAGATTVRWGPAWQRLGLYSYGIYLWHYPLLVWLPDTLAVPLTLGLAVASYHLIEAPIRQRGAVNLKLAFQPH